MSQSFEDSERFKATVASFTAAHGEDPQKASASYHALLHEYAVRLCGLSTPPILPSEALLLAANCQHIRRWEFPRANYPLGLVGYKTWRTQANKFHTKIALDTMTEHGYDVEGQDKVLADRVTDLLLKKGLARPPLTPPFKDPELQLFEDAICIVFLCLEFGTFTEQTANEDKMVSIVKKTWAKMTDIGRGVVARDLVGTLSEDLKVIVTRALE